MTIPDWQLPAGVDRGLWDYLHAADMVANYDEQMRSSYLAKTDVLFCESVFRTPGKLIDLGCGTGRLCSHFAAKGFECVGVDLSDEMLAKARENVPQSRFLKANLVDLAEFPEQSFDFAACLFSTLGMVRGAENRAKVLANAFRLLKPGGRFVLHVYNRFFLGLSLRRLAVQFVKSLFERPSAGDITMSQAYGGAPLTLHHFTRWQTVNLLWEAGFRTLDGVSLGLTRTGEIQPARWPTSLRAYGWLILSERPSE
ncbi:MAG: class I SAM-dependent methyltransferase [Planctomycetia bacterium]|nr:class I SAM-dependent methyltransferase [Planctomycetia bacterium]